MTIITSVFSMTSESLAKNIREWAQDLGFQQVGIAHTHLEQAEERLRHWLAKGFHAEMSWMTAHGNKRSRPAELEPGTLRVISVRMNYLPADTQAEEVLSDPDKAYVSRYALGRDYHKMMRKRLATLCEYIREAASDSGLARAFVDSAPVMEKPLAEKAGIGWQGKHSLIINRHAGSFFFLGEIYTDLELPVDKGASNHCGSCQSCIDVCPTGAIVAPYQVDARRCISYLTIENRGPIDTRLRPLMGNRIFGCDDCQLVCPWNRLATQTIEADFAPRHNLHHEKLVTLFLWSEQEFLDRTAGSPIRRAGYQGWLRNIAVALGNAPASDEVMAALESRKGQCSDMVNEHIHWAISQQRIRAASQ